VLNLCTAWSCFDMPSLVISHLSMQVSSTAQQLSSSCAINPLHPSEQMSLEALASWHGSQAVCAVVNQGISMTIIIVVIVVIVVFVIGVVTMVMVIIILLFQPDCGQAACVLCRRLLAAADMS
jgi:hypothetical protein